MRPSGRRLGLAVREPLARLLEEAHDGRIQVPEFQRGLILTDEWMTSLLASVSLGYPIGAVMLLEAGTTEMRFKTSPVADPPPPPREPERLLIDGRRRITGLYQALDIALGKETTTWSVRVHGGPDGRTLSDRFREAAG